eukprot:10894674-Prorocentrum_lima.AAC.1
MRRNGRRGACAAEESAPNRLVTCTAERHICLCSQAKRHVGLCRRAANRLVEPSNESACATEQHIGLCS